MLPRSKVLQNASCNTFDIVSNCIKTNNLKTYCLNLTKTYSKTCLKLPLISRQKKDLNDKINGSLIKVESIAECSLGRKYCRMLPAILSTCIKRLLVLKTIFDLLFEWMHKTGFTVPR